MLEFSDIETRRAAARIDQNELCQRANVHFMTYSRLKNRPGKHGATERTLKRLHVALDALVVERKGALNEEVQGSG
ncbi:hypothetical protein [Mesorhizobium sp. M8A.F.Ca.ET.021.01.1.1]|uniref:hypothetical protein n=1 Tax=Mesorhizobium sp. M8A.F.Ca.ET.021.01.1.1 TaxID=2496757 RepID=UPI000FCB8247|nr:hypothetical protein [Mesorhizobium sp. M8A.F.Ca.ET.021.01.1.1]RUW50972.1 hypothetical protein EOA36_15425 [Mesorhizobium sp. M8A.F.Ca.ET.021.01.1.1]